VTRVPLPELSDDDSPRTVHESFATGNRQPEISATERIFPFTLAGIVAQA
jgi:hypothetical protein